MGLVDVLNAILERTVSGHKFKIGQLVNYLGRDRAYGVYQVTQLLPPEGKVLPCIVQRLTLFIAYSSRVAVKEAR
jgi:hypothetical protein